MKGRPFRFYISASLVLLTLLVSLSVGFVLLWTLKSELQEEIADRLMNTAQLGVKTLDLEAYERLTQKLDSRTLTPEELETVEGSADYQSISAGLNVIRSMQPDLFVFAYTLFPTADPKVAKFVVDADVLELRRQLKETGKARWQLTPFNMDYKLDDQPLTVQALRDRKPTVESSFVYDYSENLNSMMGLAPIFSKSGRFLGVLGIDASDQVVSDYLGRLFWTAIAFTLAILVLILLLALWMAHRLSHPILELTESVRRISGRDWSVRVDARSKVKEIYDLKVTFNDMADRIGEYQDSLVKTNYSLLRFVPMEFLKSLDRKDITEVLLGDQVQKDMAVLHLSIRSFARLADALSPKQIFQFVNDYLGRLAPLVRDHGGFIDRYQGDGIVALFPQDCDAAVAAALAVLAEVDRINQGRESERRPLLEVGMGIHYGPMMLGTIGEERRIQGTVISDAVNVVERLMELTEEYGVGILMSKDSFNRLKHPEQVEARFVGWSVLRGRHESLPLLEVFAGDIPEQRQRKNQSKPEFERAVLLLQEGKFMPAKALFEGILRENPRDRTALRLLEHCRRT